MRWYQLRPRTAEDMGLVPTGVQLNVARDGTAFFILDGIRAIRADSFPALLKQLRLSEEDVEAV